MKLLQVAELAWNIERLKSMDYESNSLRLKYLKVKGKRRGNTEVPLSEEDEHYYGLMFDRLSGLQGEQYILKKDIEALLILFASNPVVNYNLLDYKALRKYLNRERALCKHENRLSVRDLKREQKSLAGFLANNYPEGAEELRATRDFIMRYEYLRDTSAEREKFLDHIIHILETSNIPSLQNNGKVKPDRAGAIRQRESY